MGNIHVRRWHIMYHAEQIIPIYRLLVLIITVYKLRTKVAVTVLANSTSLRTSINDDNLSDWIGPEQKLRSVLRVREL